MIDVAAGEKIPRKGGPGITKSDLFVINKTDLAPYVGADLDVMEADTKRQPSLAGGTCEGLPFDASVGSIIHKMLRVLSRNGHRANASNRGEGHQRFTHIPFALESENAQGLLPTRHLQDAIMRKECHDAI